MVRASGISFGNVCPAYIQLGLYKKSRKAETSRPNRQPKIRESKENKASFGARTIIAHETSLKRASKVPYMTMDNHPIRHITFA